MSLEDIYRDAPRDGDDPLLSADKAAKKLGLHAETVRRWIRRGDIPSERIGPHRRLVRKSVIDQFTPKQSA